jgi:hypothetical protein
MNLNSLALKLSQLKTLCSTDTNQKSVRVTEEEISELCNSIGLSSSITYLTRLLLHFHQNNQDKPVHSAFLSELSTLLTSGAGQAAFCSAADQKKSSQLLPLVTEQLNLTNCDSLALALSLTHSQSPQIREAAFELITLKVEKVFSEFLSLNEFPPILHDLLILSRNHPQLISDALKQKLSTHIEQSFHNQIPILLRPLLHPHPQKTKFDLFEAANLKMDFNSLPDLLREVGYACTATPTDCQKLLSKEHRILLIHDSL